MDPHYSTGERSIALRLLTFLAQDCVVFRDRIKDVPFLLGGVVHDLLTSDYLKEERTVP